MNTKREGFSVFLYRFYRERILEILKVSVIMMMFLSILLSNNQPVNNIIFSNKKQIQ